MGGSWHLQMACVFALIIVVGGVGRYFSVTLGKDLYCAVTDYLWSVNTHKAFASGSGSGAPLITTNLDKPQQISTNQSTNSALSRPCLFDYSKYYRLNQK